MERFGNFVFFGLKTLAFSLQPLALLPLLRTGGSPFYGLNTLAFPARHSLGVGGSLPLSRRSVTKTEALVSVIGKFGVSDQLRNGAP